MSLVDRSAIILSRMNLKVTSFRAKKSWSKVVGTTSFRWFHGSRPFDLSMKVQKNPMVFGEDLGGNPFTGWFQTFLIFTPIWGNDPIFG